MFVGGRGRIIAITRRLNQGKRDIESKDLQAGLSSEINYAGDKRRDCHKDHQRYAIIKLRKVLDDCHKKRRSSKRGVLGKIAQMVAVRLCTFWRAQKGSDQQYEE